jgi:hypothetical protein
MFSWPRWVPRFFRVAQGGADHDAERLSQSTFTKNTGASVERGLRLVITHWQLFLAITLIEEVGKVVILDDAKMGDVVAKKEFRNHQSKYVYAVGPTLAVNSRVTMV